MLAWFVSWLSPMALLEGGTNTMNTLLTLIGTVLDSVIDWVEAIITMVLTAGNEILLLPLILTFIAFAIGVFFHFVRS